MKKHLLRLCPVLLILAALLWHYLWEDWGFYSRLPQAEAQLRRSVVTRAESYLGCNEADGSYRSILETYNAQASLPQGYVLQPEDSWCAAFVSCVAIDCGITDILPTECGCQRQIGLFQELGRWEENDGYIPQPGDVIYYDWQDSGFGDCTGWADHVGLVAGIKWPFVKIIEGNKDDQVCCRYILLGGRYIRGYGLPDYGGKA